MSFEISGLDDLVKSFEQMERNAEELENNSFVPFDKLFNSNFLKKCSSFSSFEKLLDAGNFNIESQEDFDAIPLEKLDKHIASVTSFSSWNNMLEQATSEYITSELGF